MCQAGMCISLRLVEALGKANEVSKGTSLHLRDANNRKIEVCGSITLSWKWVGGTRTYNNEFDVVRPEQFDVIIGVRSICRLGLVTFNQDAMMPMIAHEKVTLG